MHRLRNFICDVFPPPPHSERSTVMKRSRCSHWRTRKVFPSVWLRGQGDYFRFFCALWPAWVFISFYYVRNKTRKLSAAGLHSLGSSFFPSSWSLCVCVSTRRQPAVPSSRVDAGHWSDHISGAEGLGLRLEEDISHIHTHTQNYFLRQQPHVNYDFCVLFSDWRFSTESWNSPDIHA